MKKLSRWIVDGADLSRRSMLRVGALSFMGMNLSRYLQAAPLVSSSGTTALPGKAQACILLWLNGGPSHIDMWDPKANSSFKPMSTNVPGIQISELLPRSARHMDKLAVIRSMHTEENNHGMGHHYVMTGHRPNPSMKFPAFSSIITKEMGPRKDVPANIIVPKIHPGYRNYYKAHFLGAQYEPLEIPDPNDQGFEVPDLSLPDWLTVERMESRRTFLGVVDQLYRRKVERAEHASMDAFRAQAWNMILSPAVREAFDLSKESEATRDAYGRNTFGQSVLIARRMVEAGSRFVTALDLNRPETGRDWDTHFGNDYQHRDYLVPVVDRALSTLLEDLEQRGLLESTVVVVTGEFGRTHDLNVGGGRDHWCHCFSVVLGGGGIRGGQVIGSSDERGAYVADRMVTVGDLLATIYKAFGIDWTKEYMHPIGRPLKIANSINDETGTPIEELV